LSVNQQTTMRRVCNGDIDALVEMRLRLLQETHFASAGKDFAEMERSFRSYFEKYIPSGEYIGWVVESKGQVIGTGGMVYWHKPPLDGDSSGREAYIMNMYTFPDWRGRGIASQLMDKLIEEARAAGIRRIRLHASETGARVYITKGFRFNSSDMILDLTK
jgi:GNAT superfamily N-acetyltransferase